MGVALQPPRGCLLHLLDQPALDVQLQADRPPGAGGRGAKGARHRHPPGHREPRRPGARHGRARRVGGRALQEAQHLEG
eukprot:15457279-Alexandrium_andersonii.AAC.1